MKDILSSKRTGRFKDIQVDPRNGVLPAGSDCVGTGGGQFESQRLYGVHIVSVITDNSSQGGFPHLIKLGEREGDVLIQTKIIEEPVTFLQPGELITNNTFKDRTQDGVLVSGLQEASDIEINIVHVSVDGPQLLDVLGVDGPPEVRPVLGPVPGADLPVLVVAGQAVVPPSLDVDGHQVQPAPAWRGLEQMVPHVLHEAVVPQLAALPGHPSHQAVQEAEPLDPGGGEGGAPQLEDGGAALPRHGAEGVRHHAVAEPKSGRGKLVVDPRVEVVRVVSGETRLP